MLKKPKNYEEAKVLLENSATDDLTKKTIKLTGLRATIVSALAVAGLAALQIIFNNPMLTAIHIPLAALLTIPNVTPYFLHKKLVKDLKSGKYFEEKNKEDVKKIADMYVDEYNHYENDKNTNSMRGEGKSR